jgi:hypothetical protein
VTLCCPVCGISQISRNSTRGLRGDVRDWLCDDGHRFDEPDRREPLTESRLTGMDGLARVLHDLDPSEADP